MVNTTGAADAHNREATHKAATISINPGITRAANRSPPEVKARTALVIEFVVTAAMIGIAASRIDILPAAANDAADTAAECASPNPAIAAATVTPVNPNLAFTQADRNVTAVTVAATSKVVFSSKMEPLGAELAGSGCFSARRVKIKPYATVTAPAAINGHLILTTTA